MADSDSDMSRTDSDFGWVSDLPTFTGLLPVSTSSLLPRFSLFSLFRSARPAIPQASQLQPLHSLFLHSANSPTAKEVFKGLTAVSDYVTLLKTSCVGLDESKAEEAEQWVLRAMEGYLAAIALVSRLTFQEPASELGATLPQSLRGLFTIHAHYVGSSRPGVTTWLGKVTANLLAAPHVAEDDETRDYLVPLFSQTREIIRSLQHAARANYTKGANGIKEDEAGDWDARAGERMEWLRLFADHVRGLDGLEAVIGRDETGRKVTKKAAALAVKEAQERPMRIAIEADLLRCDLAISMATTKIAEVKRRARAQLLDAGGEAGMKEEGEVKEEGMSRKRRALTDESDLETVVADQPEWESATTGAGDTGGRMWEGDVEIALLETLKKVREILEEKHSEVLVAQIDRSDWLSDPIARQQSRSPSKPKVDGTEGDIDSSDGDETLSSSESENSTESDSSDDDLSHPCPLRSLFRLHDRYEEQRLAVWLSLPSERRGKMGAYMRGVEGRVGAAWDAVGLLLLKELRTDVLESFGLSLDKHDKWVELESRRNTKKIRKKGRTTL